MRFSPYKWSVLRVPTSLSMLLQSTPFADSVRTHMVERLGVEPRYTLLGPRAYKARAITILLALDNP